MKIALLCSGLGNVHRGHEVFARDLFDLISDSVDITLFKGGGQVAAREWVIDNVPRDAPYLDKIYVAVSPKWEAAVREQERNRIEAETFAYAALRPLLEGGFDIIHCLEQEVCNIIYSQRHLFRNTPRIMFSNGGAIPGRNLPRCDFVQEHTDYNLTYSAKKKAFMIPHGLDLTLFNPDVKSDFREQYGIPNSARVAISVGTIGYWHKRMDYVIKEIAPIENMYLIIAGQECTDTPAIKEIGKHMMGDRVVFVTLPHDELPKAYAAADVFILGSLFEAFGIVYLEAMAMGLPVICTNHPNQRSIVREGIFIDMKSEGALTDAVRRTDQKKLDELAKRGQTIVTENYDLKVLKRRYIEKYTAISTFQPSLPRYTMRKRLSANIRGALKKSMQIFYGRAD